MKANEAPEKIFLDEDESWHLTNPNGDSVEYIRTDALLEKAENFLEMLGYGFTITDNITHANYGKEQLIDDFTKAMKL